MRDLKIVPKNNNNLNTKIFLMKYIKHWIGTNLKEETFIHLFEFN